MAELDGVRSRDEDIKAGLREIMHKRIDNDFTYHSPTGEKQVQLYEDVRDSFRRLAHYIVETVPPGREQATALTNLEQVMFWCNAGITRSQ